MKIYAFLLALIASVAVAAATHVASWTAPITNTDGTAITGTLTYNVYNGAKGAETLQGNVTATSASVTGPCVYVTAVEGTTESAPSNEVCLHYANPPSGLSLQ
jgi:hypothetical protein